MSKVTEISKAKKKADNNALKAKTAAPISKPETFQEAISRLAALSVIDYERVRKEEAEKLGVRTSILDSSVAAERAENNKKPVVENIEPWQEPVNLAQVLEEMQGLLKRHVILPKGANTAITLWTASTYLINAFRIYPKLIIHSPEKRCGKSTALDMVDAFANKAMFTSNISPAAIFRVIDAYQPTLIIDEADTFIAGRDGDIIGIINSGHAKTRAFVTRVEGDNHEPQRFSTWAPMALASIKRLQGTIMDRGVIIELRRKMKDETTQRLPADLFEQTYPIRQKLKRWADDHFQAVIKNQIEPPANGNDRAVDNWLPLFTLAHHAGKQWQQKVEASYQLLTNREEEHTPQIMLLQDIKSIFDEEKAKQPPPDELDEVIERKPIKISSSELVDRLVALEERPWCEWKGGSPLTKNSLAKNLKAFNIHSKQMRIFGNKARGYEIEQFQDAFKRYLPE